MLVLVTYDVNTSNAAGRRRLRLVAKACTAHGQRVQNSVFECSMDAAQFKLFRHELLEVIDPAMDSLRLYMLGNHVSNKVEHIGAKPTYMPDDVLML